jgi:hypothetical protein
MARTPQQPALVHFVTYGDHRFAHSKLRIAKEAAAMGFDHIGVYGPEHLPPDFIQRTAPYIHEARGAGYWIWKPYILKITFGEMRPGDICTYADAGCRLNPRGSKRLTEYFEMLNDASGCLSLQVLGHTERMHTCSRLFDYYAIGADDPVRDTDQLIGGILFFRKCETTQRIVDEFYETALRRPDLFTDAYNHETQDPAFAGHRHDQSVLSLIRKRAGTVIIPDETYPGHCDAPQPVPILAARIRQSQPPPGLWDRIKGRLRRPRRAGQPACAG